MADVRETDRILEPSAGTGAILQAIRDAVPRAKCDAVELHAGLARHLQAHFPEVRIWCGDFLEYHPERRYTRIIMNPPFNRGDDIRHSRINSDVARRIPGLHRDPKDRLSSLKQVEEALDMLISSHGEYCPLPLTMDVQAELFPEVLHTRTVRRLKRQDFAFTRKMRREARQVEQSWLLRQNLLGQAVTELNFQSPETVCTWYTRWSDEFDAAELAAPFWRWQSRFESLKELDWLRISGEPLYAVMYEIPFIVRETPEHIRVAERWQVPNKLADRSGV
ncbi:plasmid SOS inhibition protein A [Klebsiella michiganensis]|nr:plasmid SOS inhibition protein A [Klebsiella michiganensis]MBD0960169.1 plasmid SOS inhibition protein A [Klebsiella michiganensis]